MAKILLPILFFATTPILLFLSLLYLAYISYHQNYRVSSALSKQNVLYAAIPTSESLFQHSINEVDSRVETVKDFFTSYNSPLTPFAKDIIDAADKYDIDYRLLPAIAMQESNLCKRIIKNSYNCWGWGIYGKTVTKFESYSQAIDVISKTLGGKYRNNGLETLAEIQTKYNPSNTHDWEGGVSHFMDKLQIEFSTP